jgi:hypothetical protein
MRASYQNRLASYTGRYKGRKKTFQFQGGYGSGNIRYCGNPLSIGEPEVCYVDTNCHSAFDADIQTLLSQKATTGHGANRSRESTSKV